MINEYKSVSAEKVYLPLTDPQYKIANVSVEVGTKVLVGTVLGYKYKGAVKLPVISSVSGTVEEFVELQDRFGKTVDHCVILNDNEYNSVEVKPLENPSSTQIRTRLLDFGIETVDVDGPYTAIKFDKPIKHVVVNASFTNEPFIKTEYKLLNENAEDVAKGINILKLAANAETATVLAAKKMDPFAFNALGEAIVDKNIDLVTVKVSKVNGGAIRAIQKIIEKPASKNLLNDGVLFVSAQTAKLVYDLVEKGIVPNKKEVVITGDVVKENVVVNAVVGTKLTDVVEELGGYNEVEEVVLHVGNFLTGNQITTDETAITLNVDHYDFSEYFSPEEDVCTKCGECNDICPVGILPQNIMDAELRAVNERIVDLDTNACIECGLCSYSCPSNINVLEWVRRAKRRVG